MRARYYNPTIQRFVNIDPIRDRLNWYGYAGGNSVNNIDPYGTISDYDIIEIQKDVFKQYISEKYKGLKKEVKELPNKIAKGAKEIWNNCSEIAFDYFFPYDDSNNYTREPYLDSDGLYCTPIQDWFGVGLSASKLKGQYNDRNIKNKDDWERESDYIGAPLLNQDAYATQMKRIDYNNEFYFHLFHENMNANACISTLPKKGEKTRQGIGVDTGVNFLDASYAAKIDIAPGIFIKIGFNCGIGIAAGVGHYKKEGLKARAGVGITGGISIGFGRRFE